MKYFKITIFSVFWLALFALSCNRDNISFGTPSQMLRFSTDTVFCDTVYNQIRSETYDVKVYNSDNKDVKIPRIYLAGGSASPYRINVDGKAGTDFANVPLRKNDSLFIFVEIAPVASATEAIAEDQIIFESPAGQQHVTLFSVVQDAEFFIQSKTNPNILNDDTTWTNEKVKIIFGDLTLAEGKTLTIQEGTKVCFHKNSSLKIAKNAILNVNGTLENNVIFRGDRNNARYDTIPRNWNTIDFDIGSKLNINYGKIFGGTVGLSMNQTTANISNTIIHTFQDYGISAVNSNITATNTVMNNCGVADLGIFKGGNIDFTHCTLANYWSLNAALGFAILATNDWTNDSGQPEYGALHFNFKNSIAYTSFDNAIFFSPTQGQVFSTNISNSLLKYTDNSFGFDFNNAINSIKGTDENYPEFLNFYISKMNLRVKDGSPAKGKGDLGYAAQVPLDYYQIDRTSSPTIGAYQ